MKKLLFTLVALLVALTGFAADNLLSGGTNLPVMLQRSDHVYTDTERGYLVDGVMNATESNTVNLALFYADKNDGFYFDLGSTTKIGVVKIFWTGKHCTKYKIYGSNNVPTLDSPGTEIGSFDEYGALGDDTRYKSYAGGAGQEFRYVAYVPDATANFYGSMMSEFEIFSYEESVLTSLSLNTQISVYNTAGNGFNAAPIDQNGNSMSSGVTYTADNGATINANGNAFTLVAPAAGVYTVTATAGDKTATTKVALLDASGMLAAPTNNSNSVQTVFCDTYSSTEPGISDPGWNWKYTTRARPEIASGNYIYIVDKVGTFGLNPGAVDLSEYDKLNLDIYAVEATPGYVVVEGANLNLPFALSAGWNRLALDVSESTATAATWIQVYVGANNADNNRSIAVDNVFYSKPEVDDSEAPVLETPVVASVNASSATLSLKATDDKATSIKYTITYGENSVTATGASGEITEVIVSGLTPETDYTFSVVANDGKNDSESKTVNVTTTAMPKAPVPAPARSVSIYGTKLGNATGYGWYDWGGGSGSVTTLKNTDNEDIEAYVISNFKWFGSQFGQIDAKAAEMKTLHFDIYSATTTTLAVVPINAALEGNGNQPEKGYQFNITGGEWNAIEVPLADVIADGVSMTKFYQVKYVSKVANKAAVGTSDGFENGDGTLSFIVANVYLEGDPIIDTENPVLVTAEAVTGAETTTSVSLSLNATDDKAATIKYEIVNASDANHHFTTSGANGEAITYELTGLEPGTEYTFNVTAYDAAENASTAAQVTVSTKAIAVPGAAPQPTTATENVKSVYSDQYTSLANLEFANWAGTAKGQGKKELATGDQAYYVIGLGNIFGLDFHETLDVTGMEKLHLDIWSEAAQTIKISPIWGETKDDQKEVSLTAGEWTSVDLTLADFANIDLTSVYQIELLNGDGTSVIYLDNIYFWKSAGEVPTTEKTVYLNPAIWEVNGEDSEWNEVFAAYVYGDGLDASWLTMDKVDDTPYYTVAIPASYTGLIFTRRQVGTEMNWDNVWNQTVDIDFTSVEDNTLFTITAWHENDDESKPSTVESTLYVEPTSFTVTFKNSIGWENVYAYTYNSETLGAWPGKAMTIVDGVYTVSFKAVAAPANIIFNNGGSGEGNQTEDLVFENGKEYDMAAPVVHEGTQYTSGDHNIWVRGNHYVDTNTYELIIESDEDMDGLGGSFWNVNGVGTDMRTNLALSTDKKTMTVTCVSTSAPNIYTPLYVMMPGEVNFGNITVEWNEIGGTDPVEEPTSGEASATITSTVEAVNGKTLNYTWAFTQTGADVTVTFECTNKSDIDGIVDGFVIADGVEIQGEGGASTLTYTWTGCTEGQVVKAKHKWMFAGGDFMTPEYSYTVKAIEPVETLPTIPTEPTANAENVLAVYSATYGKAELTTTNPGWGGYKDATGNDLYASFEYLELTEGENTHKVVHVTGTGINSRTAGDVAASGYTQLYAAIWPTTATSGVAFQDNGYNDRITLGELTPGQWNYVELPVSFTNNYITIALDGETEFYIDHIYYTKPDADVLVISEPDDRGIVNLTGGLNVDNMNELASLDAPIIDITGLDIDEAMTAITTANPNVLIIVPGTVEENVATSELANKLTGNKNFLVKNEQGYLFPISQLEIVDDGQSPVWTGFFVSTNTVGYAYSRTIPAGEYTTAYLPAASTAVEGLKVYTFKSYENSQIELEEKTDGVIPANTPVVLYNATDADLTITAEGTGDLNFGGTPATVEQGGASFTGNYKVEAAAGLFTVGAAASAAPARRAQSGSTLTVKAVEGKTVPFRAYFKGVTEGEDISTAIDGLRVSRTLNGKAYTLDGREVKGTLQKGIYIIDGKKVVIK